MNREYTNGMWRKAAAESHPGWWRFLEPIFDKIDKDPKCVVGQVKEKFGTLRFYVDYATPEINEMIDAAEKWSGKYCEDCGAPAKVRTDGWVRVLCDVHEEKYRASH